MTPLERQYRDAVTNGKLEDIRQCLMNGMPVDKLLEYSGAQRLNEDGQRICNYHTALAICASKGYEDCIAFLIESGADVNARCTLKQESVLAIAVEQGNMNSIKHLVSKGADVFEKDRVGNSLVSVAAKKDNLAAIQYFVDLGVDIHSSNDRGVNALHWSLNGRGFNCAKYLIERGIDINKQDIGGCTALHRVLYRRNDGGMVKWLVERGGDLSIKDSEGIDGHWLIRKNCFMNAIGEFDLEKVESLLNAENDVYDYHKEALKITLEGPLPSFASNSGNDYLAISMSLVRHGVDIETRSNRGLTALVRMAQYNLADNVNELLKRGASIDAKSPEGRSALDYAIMSGSVESAIALLTHGASHDGIESLMEIAERYSGDEMVDAIKGFQESIILDASIHGQNERNLYNDVLF